MDAISRSKEPLSRLMALADLLKDRNLLTMQKGILIDNILISSVRWMLLLQILC
jgi:hypothetical protein